MLFDIAVLRSVGYYKTVLYPRKGSSDSSHIPQPAIAGLGFAPNGASRPIQIEMQTTFMPLYAPCFLRKTSTRPSGSLRMTKSAYGF